jgi:ABC-type bacteriocin/lantibiotic exporter with double-glycine peptidase domain
VRLRLLVALAGVAGCVSYSGGARPVDPARVNEPGWIVAGVTRETRQQGSYDCGAASLAMVASRWNVPLSLAGATAGLPKPTDQGVPLGDLRDLARARGLTAFAIAGDQATLVHELRAGRPVIVGLHLPYGGKRVFSHYEVIVAVHPGEARFVTIDPASGWRSRTWAELDAEWKPAGRPTLVVLGRANYAAVLD